MTLRRSKFPRATLVVLTLATGLGLAAAFALPSTAENTAGQADGKTAKTAAIRCQALLTERGGMVEIVASVKTARAATGIYEMDITSAGGNSISQAGDFESVAGHRVELSHAMLSGRAGDHSVHLTVRVGGKTYGCTSSETDL